MPSSTTDPYALRFEGGERKGETVSFGSTGASLGRRSGNTIQVLDASVSGEHAEIVVDDEGVLLRDLDSTNGTRLGGERVRQGRLAHGDAIQLGNVRLTFLDHTLGLARPARAATEAPGVDADAAGEGVQHISADKVASLGKRSVWPLVIGAVLTGAVVVTWWQLRGFGSGEKAPGLAPVIPVEGNLLAEDYSFEAEALGWSAVDAAPVAFTADAGSAVSGAAALLADLGGGEWARHLSPQLPAPAGRTLEARGWLQVDGACCGALGLHFTDSLERWLPTIAWANPVAGTTDGFTEVLVASPVPPGYDRVEVLLHAVADAEVGSVVADDVSLVLGAGAGTTGARVDEYQLHCLGNGFVGSLFKIDRVLVSGLQGRPASAESVALCGQLPLLSSAAENGMEIGVAGAADLPLRFSFRAEPGASTGGIATVGAGGYRNHPIAFEREATSSLLVGEGRNLLRFKFAEPVTVAGRPHEGGFQFELMLPAGAGFLLQVSFKEERARAEELADRGRQSQREGQLGASLAFWNELLDEYPFETALVSEAESSRSQLIQTGLEEVREVRAEMERARFFRLVDLFRQCRQRAEAIAERFAKSEVEDACAALIEEIDAELVVLETDLDRAEAARLASILSVLEAGEMPTLSAAVRQYLEENFPAATAAPETNDAEGE